MVDEEQPLLTGSINGSSAKTYDGEANTSSTTPRYNEHPPAVYLKLAGGITKGHLLLLVVAVMYGTLFVAQRGIYATPQPPTASALSAVRGWLAVLCFVPMIYFSPKKNDQPKPSDEDSHDLPKKKALWIVAAELAVWNCLAQGLPSLGLTYIESARAAFIIQLSVVITPVLASFTGIRVKRIVWVACGVALLGLVLLCTSSSSSESTNDDDNGADTTPTTKMIGTGDILCLGGAASMSLYFFRTSAIADSYDSLQLQATKNVFVACFYSLWCVVEMVARGGTAPWGGYDKSLLAWALLLYAAAGPGSLADIWQQNGQATVTATVANIILSLEPVFTAIFGRLMLGELITGREKLGGGLILLAAMVASQG